MLLSLTWWFWPCMWHLWEAQCCNRYQCPLDFFWSTQVQNSAKETDLAKQVNCPEGSCLLEEWNLIQAPHCHTAALISELIHTLCSSPQSTSCPAGTLGEEGCNCCPSSQLHPFLSASSVPRKPPWDEDPWEMAVSEDLSVCPCTADRSSGSKGSRWQHLQALWGFFVEQWTPVPPKVRKAGKILLSIDKDGTVTFQLSPIKVSKSIFSIKSSSSK